MAPSPVSSPGLRTCQDSSPGARHRESQCAPNSVVQWKPYPTGRRETWTLVQGLPLTDTLRRVLSIPFQDFSLTI